MGLIAQYAAHGRENGKLHVRFAIWDEAKPSPVHTVKVDATEMNSLEEIEAAAFAYFAVADGHFLEEDVKKACQEGRQVKQPEEQAEHFDRLYGRTPKSSPETDPTREEVLARGQTVSQQDPVGAAAGDPDERLIGQ